MVRNFRVIELAELHPDSATAAFWSAAAEHRLVVPHCIECGHQRMPPSPFCPHCRTQRTSWREVTGRAVVYAYTVVRHPVADIVTDQVPYALAVVELDDAPGIRLVVNLWHADTENIRIGLPVEVCWDDVGECAIPRFRPVRR